MFNKALHRRLEGEEVRELKVPALASFCDDLEALTQEKGWERVEAMRQILAAGLQAVRLRTAMDKEFGSLPVEERLRFLQDRWSAAEAAYSTLKFQAHQVMNQNDTLEMNLRGLLPQLEAAKQRVGQLEDEVRRLRQLVPPDQRSGDVLVLDREVEPKEEPSVGDRLRRMFTGDET